MKDAGNQAWMLLIYHFFFRKYKSELLLEILIRCGSFWKSVVACPGAGSKRVFVILVFTVNLVTQEKTKLGEFTMIKFW